MVNINFPLGKELRSIEYELLDWEELPCANALVDWVNMAIRLTWGDDSVTWVTWRNPSYWEEEGLRFCGR